MEKIVTVKASDKLKRQLMLGMNALRWVVTEK